MAVPTKVSRRLASNITRFQKLLRKAQDQDINESDTSVIITDILCYLFGFDKYSEITTEYSIRGTYCDLIVKIRDKARLITECKAVGIGLKDGHVKQAVDYAANMGIEWVVLTNGIDWQVFRVLFSKPISKEMVGGFDFLKLNPKSQTDLELLHLLTKEGFEAAVLSDYFEKQQAVNRFTVAAVIQTSPVVSAIRRELKGSFDGIRVSTEEIERIIATEVLKREVLEDDKAQDARKKINRALAKKKKVDN